MSGIAQFFLKKNFYLSMSSNNISSLSFQSYLSEAKNGFRKSDDVYIQNKYIQTQITDFYTFSKNNQGIIGKTWDKIKCMLNMKSSSKNTEKILNDYSNNINNSSHESSAIIGVNNYAKSQAMASSIARNFIASVGAGGTFALANKIFKPKNNKVFAAIVATTAVIGGLLGTVTKAIDTKSADKKYDKKDFIKDFTLGTVQGAISSGCSFGIMQFVGNKLAIVPKMLLKSVLKLCINSYALYSSSLLEYKCLGFSILKGISPVKYETVMDKISKQEQMDKYQFYNPRYELNNN